MNAGRRRARWIFALVASLSACAPIPTLTFFGQGEGGTPAPDATVTGPDDAGGERRNDAAVQGPDVGTSEDGSDESDDAPIDQPSDDAGDAAPTIKCGTNLVSDCVSCPNLPLLCKKAGRCVADCTQCAAGMLPCVHCATPDAAPHGTCLQVMGDGQIACTRVDLCGCNVDTDCLAINGAAQTCDLQGTKRVGCLTCGGPTTAGLPCVSASGATGTCTVADATAPKCE